METKESLANTAYRFLKNEIVSLRLASGDQLQEEKIANQLNMSRTPVRRAIRMLADEGFVTVVRSKGATVTYITPDDINELCDLRLLIEGWALEQSIDKIPDEKLDEAEENFIAAAETQSIEKHHYADRFLHNLFVEYSDSKRVATLLESLGILTDWYKAKAKLVTDFEISRKEHLEIIYAIKRRNIREARHVLEVHIYNVRRRFLASSPDAKDK